MLKMEFKWISCIYSIKNILKLSGKTLNYDLNSGSRPSLWKKWNGKHIWSLTSTKIIQKRYKSIFSKCPLQKKVLINFEKDLKHFVKDVKFRKVHNTFHEKLKIDLIFIEKSNNVFLFVKKCEFHMKLAKKNIEFQQNSCT